MNPYTIWFSIFILIAYFVVTDSSVAKLVVILTQFARLQYEKAKWWIVYNPRNPINKYLMWRRAYKLAEELQKEREQKLDPK